MKYKSQQKNISQKKYIKSNYKYLSFKYFRSFPKEQTEADLKF